MSSLLQTFEFETACDEEWDPVPEALAVVDLK
jgi:hypothetical protein